MTVTLDIDQAAFEQSVMQQFASVKVPCQFEMAKEFKRIVDANFTVDGGEDRPAWKDLSSVYQRKIDYSRSNATLLMSDLEVDSYKKHTGKSVVAGKLMASTRINADNSDAAVVFNDCEYAAVHQDGGVTEDGWTVPPRPFFPIQDGEVTPYTTQKCLDACQATLERELK
jgi:phage gpG-like protein